jgi:hypothetical protein
LTFELVTRTIVAGRIYPTSGSSPKDGEAEKQQRNEDDAEDVKQDTRNIGACRR